LIHFCFIHLALKSDSWGALQPKTGRDWSPQLRLWLVARRDRSWFWWPVLDLQRGHGGNKFKDFPENQMPKFHANFPIFMRNLETREYCKISKCDCQ